VGHICSVRTLGVQSSGNIQGTFRAPPGNVQGTFREHCSECWFVFKNLVAAILDFILSFQIFEKLIPGTFGEHSGNIWGTFGEHLGNIWGTFGEHLGNIWGTFGEHLGDIEPPAGSRRWPHLRTSVCHTRRTVPRGYAAAARSSPSTAHIAPSATWEHSGNIQGTFREHSGNIQGTFREHSGNIQDIGEHSRNFQGTFGEHSGLINSSYCPL
jgi:hypothetical protein